MVSRQGWQGGCCEAACAGVEEQWGFLSLCSCPRKGFPPRSSALPPAPLLTVHEVNEIPKVYGT